MDIGFFLIDAVCLILFLITVLISAKKGLILSLLDFAAAFLAYFLAKIFSAPCAVMIYDNLVKNSLTEYIEGKFDAIGSGISVTAEEALSKLSFLPKSFMDYVSEKGLFDSAQISDALQTNIVSAQQLENDFLRPLFTKLLGFAAFAAICLLSMIILKLIFHLIGRGIKEIKIIKKTDTALGALIGLLKGVMYSGVFALLMICLSYASDSVAKLVSTSYYCSFLIKLLT